MRRKAEAKSELDEEKAVMAADIDVLRKEVEKYRFEEAERERLKKEE
eukprot:gene6421-7697_t